MKDIKIYFMRFIQIMVVLAGVVIIYAGFDYVISDDTEAQTRVTFHEFYNEDDIDYLFVGPSHSVHDINAVVLSEKLGKNVFNLSTKSQDIHNAYYVIKEAVETKNIKHIFYEISFSRLKIKNSSETSTYIISDYLQSPQNKIELILSSFKRKKYMNSFFRLRRNLDPQEIPSMEYIDELYQKKQEKGYIDYLGTEEYLGKGQWSETDSEIKLYESTFAFNYNATALDNFQLEDVTDAALTYLQKIIDLCNEKGIELTFYITPYTEVYISNFEQYDAIADLIYRTAEKNNVPVVDLNLVKDEYLNFTVDDFYNLDHNRTSFSEKIAAFFADYITDPAKDYFLSSIHEKYPETDEILAIGYNRYFVSEQGEYLKLNNVKGTVDRLRLEISAYGYADIETDVRMWRVEQEEDTAAWENRKEIFGEKTDAFTTQFIVPYDELETSYRVQLLDPYNGDVLYETITKFDMN